MPMQQQTKFLVFEDALMALFRKCEICRDTGTRVQKTVLGSFVRLRQTCHHCGHVREWDSQPFIKNIPAGNILLSAAILFSGGLPAHVNLQHLFTSTHLFVYTNTFPANHIICKHLACKLYSINTWLANNFTI